MYGITLPSFMYMYIHRAFMKKIGIFITLLKIVADMIKFSLESNCTKLYLKLNQQFVILTSKFNGYIYTLYVEFI